MRRMKKVAAATLTAIMVASIAMGTTESWARSSTRAAWNNAAAQSKDEEQIVNDACYAEDGSVTEERNVKSNVYANSEEWAAWKTKWESVRNNFCQIALTPGENATKLNAAWYSTTEGETPKITSLLEEGISKEVIATALMNTEAGTTGNKFLAEIGLSNSTDIENLPYVSAVKNTILTSLFVMLFLWTLLLFLGTMLFLYRRERLYRESENIIKDYIDGNYTVHLPQSNEGTIYQLLSSVDQLATMLQAKNDTEQKTKEFLKNTISDISHQLKTPLSALMMYQEIIENEPENFETVKEFSLKIGTALKRMEQLIQSMLKITRIDAGSISFEKSNYSIPNIINHAISELTTRADNEKKEIVIDGDLEQMLYCDIEWTGEAIGNIIKNALDHTDTGGKISISWEQTPAMIRIFITDNGHGISQEDMPAFSISYPSIIAGIVVGLLTVLLAARSPAKKASKVSPLAAVSGNANDLQPVKKAANTKFFKIDTSLGIHHAKASKKNFILMISSFSISIILFLAFSVTIDFMNHTLTPLQPWTADISVISPEDTCSVKAEFIEELQQNPAVKNVYGRMFAYNVPVIVNGEEKVVDLISYEDMQFDWAKDYVLSGSLEKAQSESNTGLIVFEPQNDIEVGNVITLNLNGSQADMEIVGMLSDCPFNNRQDVGKLICSEDTFRKLTGETDYSIIDIQLSQNATENDVNEIHRLVGSQYTFSDERMGNSNTRGAYYCFGLFIYGFLVLIALITLFNIINSIAMSVVAKMKQYGVFRAIGLSNRQLAKMIIAEASTYAITGTICGSVLGIVCNKILFSKLITYKWGDAWSVPLVQLGIIIVVVAIAVILAVRNPIKKLEKTSIVDIISVQ